MKDEIEPKDLIITNPLNHYVLPILEIIKENSSEFSKAAKKAAQRFNQFLTKTLNTLQAISQALDEFFDKEYQIKDVNGNIHTIKVHKFYELIEYIAGINDEFILDNINEIHQETIRILNTIDPQYPIMLLGAYESIENKQSDYKRHVLISLRELLSIMLRDFAPDEDVYKWLETFNHGESEYTYINNGIIKLTRKARIEYICSKRENNCFSDFLLEEQRGLKSTIDELNKIHSTLDHLQDNDLIRSIIVTEAWAIFLCLTHIAIEVEEKLPEESN